MLRAKEIINETDRESDPEFDDSLRARIGDCLREDAPWWICSFTIHFVGLSLLALFAGNFSAEAPSNQLAFQPAEPEAETVDAPDTIVATPPPPHVIDIDPEIPPIESLADLSSKEQGGGPDVSTSTVCGVNSVDLGSPFGGGTFGFNSTGVGNNLPNLGLECRGDPKGTPGGKGPTLGPRGQGLGVVPRTVVNHLALALKWLARHQSPDGSWSLQGYTRQCTDKTCTGQGSVQADSAATALGLLPFLAHGQTHRAKCQYQQTVSGAIYWLVRNQRPDGDLRGGATMYAQGLATIALCEAYAMTGDKSVGVAAQRAVDFIETAQHPTTGGWRYKPGDEGDLSVVGWQVMALKSAQMAGLTVHPAVLERAGKYVQSVSSGSRDTGRIGQFTYQPNGAPSNAMTAAGLLCTQYLGAPRNDPVVRSGTSNIMQHLPDNSQRDLYYWYYASQVMHNQPGPDWDVWNRKTRNLLCETQCREGCASGSWDPQLPSPDRWGAQGGRVMTTSLATLTLEVYLRYLPLYKFEPAIPAIQRRAGE